VTSQLARSADDTIKINDDFGKVIGESLGKAIGDNVREKAGKKNVRYQVNNTVGQFLNNADYII
jgi:hypothetical protein